MEPAAKPFFRASFLAFEHALEHIAAEGPADGTQVILSLDLGVDMLLKAVLSNRGISIFKSGGRLTLGPLDSLKLCGSYKYSSWIEILREKRNHLQHLTGYTDANSMRDEFEATMLFVEEVLQADFGQELPSNLRVTHVEAQVVPSPTAKILFEVEQLQRDVNASDSGVITWSQSDPATDSLVVFVKIGENEPKRLSPLDEFEYMPKVFGDKVVCHRQMGGVILYNLTNGSREIISESGLPTAINDGWIVGQGFDDEAGFGGGIWIYDFAKADWQRVSDGGDSARLTDKFIVWQELVDGALAIKYRELQGEEIGFITNSGTQPSPYGDLVAWIDWRRADARLHVTRFDGTEVYSVGSAIFPYLWKNYVSYLVSENDSYTLVVDDIYTGSSVLSLPWVGFPMGDGSCLAQGEVFFESKAGRGVHAIWHESLFSPE